MNPDFLCVGTYRSGTTWLYKILKQHPDLFLPDEKELMFFSHHYDKGISWYKSFFDSCGNHQISGDITPTYLSCPDAPQRIAESLPDIKIIAILRNPPDQIFSLYQLWLSRNYTKSSLDKALLKSEGEFLDNVHYYKHLSNYMAHIDSENILVLFYEDLKNDSVSFLKKVYDFLSLEYFFPDNLQEKQNQFRKPKNLFFETIITGTGDLLRKMRLLKLKSKLNNLGVSEYLKRMNTATQKKAHLSDEMKTYIDECVKQDKDALKKLIGSDLEIWE